MPPDDPPEVSDHDLRFDDVTQLSLLRSALRSGITQNAFTDQAADDVLVAVTEVASNRLAHGAAPVRVRVWHHGTTLVVQVDDSGGYRLPAGAGYRRAPSGQTPWAGVACGWAGNSPTPSPPIAGRGAPLSGCTFPRELTNRSPT